MKRWQRWIMPLIGSFWDTHINQNYFVWNTGVNNGSKKRTLHRNPSLEEYGRGVGHVHQLDKEEIIKNGLSKGIIYVLLIVLVALVLVVVISVVAITVMKNGKQSSELETDKTVSSGDFEKEVSSEEVPAELEEDSVVIDMEEDYLEETSEAAVETEVKEYQLLLGTIQMPVVVDDSLWFEIADSNAEDEAVTTFYVYDRTDPVFALQEGGEKPESGIEMDEGVWLIPYYQTYDEHEEKAFGNKESDKESIFDSDWFIFCRNAEQVFYCGIDGKTISFDEVMYSAEHQSSKYAENKLLYHNNDYNYTVVFPDSAMKYFEKDALVGYYWYDYPLKEGAVEYALSAVNGVGWYSLLSIVSGKARLENEDHMTLEPIYRDDSCYIKIDLQEPDGDDNVLIGFNKVADETIIKLPDGSEHLLSEYY